MSTFTFHVEIENPETEEMFPLSASGEDAALVLHAREMLAAELNAELPPGWAVKVEPVT
jgi:hypothetical protein